MRQERPCIKHIHLVARLSVVIKYGNNRW